MSYDLRSRFETTDGSRPSSLELDDKRARAMPLSALSFLSGGDAFDAVGSARVDDSRARRWTTTHLQFDGAPRAAMDRVVNDAVRMLAANTVLLSRMELARPIRVDVVKSGGAYAALGFPASTNEHASGLFWDHPSWPAARIALRIEHLDTDEVLVVHEMAHAVHALAFTAKERETIYGVLRPTFIDRSSMDEAFAIYTEREFCRDFDALARKAPGIYGFVRRQWHEDQLFVRFIRKLWFPHRPLAGPKMPSASSWKKFAGS